MKATGIVRRIDDLGRVVIPKEIRRTMRIRDGDPLEIFTGPNEEVVFKKYSPIGEITEFAVQYADVLSRACGLPVVEGRERLAGIAAPIVSAGDVTGCVCVLQNDTGAMPGEVDVKLAQVAAAFLGKQMEE